MLDVPGPGLGAATFQVQWDPLLLSATNCIADPNEAFDTALCSLMSDTATVTLLSTAGVTGNETLANITFQAIGPVYSAAVLDLSLTTFSDAFGAAITPIEEDGLVNILPYSQIAGDVNCDLDVNSVDALFILQFSVGDRAPSDQCPPPPDTIYLDNCDVNSDSACDSVDALFIMQCEVGIPNALCPVAASASITWPFVQSQAAILQTNEQLTRPGETTEVGLSAELPAGALAAATVKLTYDPTILRPLTCTADPTGRFDMSLCRFDLDGIYLSLLSAAGVDGEFTLADVTFEAIGDAGSASPVGIEAQTLANTAGQALDAETRVGHVVLIDKPIYLPVMLR